MLELDLLGKLELYRSCFDLDDYNKNRAGYLKLIVQSKDRDPFMKELHEYAITHSIALPAYENKKIHNDPLIPLNIVNQVLDSLHKRGVRQTLSVAIQRMKRRVR